MVRRSVLNLFKRLNFDAMLACHVLSLGFARREVLTTFGAGVQLFLWIVRELNDLSPGSCNRRVIVLDNAVPFGTGSVAVAKVLIRL